MGWRAWRIRDSGQSFVLTSATTTTEWVPGEPLEASCERGSHLSPSAGCTCGVYASCQPGPALTFLPPYARAVSSIIAPAILGYDRVVAIGVVALWGEVVVCDWGWRAQFAYPTKIFVPSSVKHYRRARAQVEIFDSADLADAIAVAYGVSAEVAWNLRPLPLATLARGAA